MFQKLNRYNVPATCQMAWIYHLYGTYPNRIKLGSGSKCYVFGSTTLVAGTITFIYYVYLWTFEENKNQFHYLSNRLVF